MCEAVQDNLKNPGTLVLEVSLWGDGMEVEELIILWKGEKSTSECKVSLSEVNG